MLRHVDLLRTFTRPSTQSEEEEEEEEEDWTTYLDATHGKPTWSDLHEKHVVVVVGEAGIGKTTEFKDEMARLRTQGKVAA